jgi:hypothetical protein
MSHQVQNFVVKGLVHAGKGIGLDRVGATKQFGSNKQHMSIDVHTLCKSRPQMHVLQAVDRLAPVFKLKTVSSYKFKIERHSL